MLFHYNNEFRAKQRNFDAGSLFGKPIDRHQIQEDKNQSVNSM
jgi:hypothetical protein